MFNDYLTDTNDKLNSIKYCTADNLKSGFVIEKSLLSERLDMMKLDVLSKTNRISIGRDIIKKFSNTESLVSSVDDLYSQYKLLYTKIDTVQKSLNRDRYILTSQLVEYLKNV